MELVVNAKQGVKTRPKDINVNKIISCKNFERTQSDKIVYAIIRNLTYIRKRYCHLKLACAGTSWKSIQDVQK